MVEQASEAALRFAYDMAGRTQGRGRSRLGRALAMARGETWHKWATAAAGGIGGAFGLAGTLIDLPATTTLILRSIQQIAESHGEDIADPAVRMQSLAVFALGGPLPEDDSLDSGLWTVRSGAAMAITAENIKQALASDLFRQIAQRFGIVVGNKAAAMAAPIAGAVAGAAINPVFTGYYQTMAHVHFRLRRLERAHDPDQVHACFERIVRDIRRAKPPRIRIPPVSASPARPRRAP